VEDHEIALVQKYAQEKQTRVSLQSLLQKGIATTERPVNNQTSNNADLDSMSDDPTFLRAHNNTRSTRPQAQAHAQQIANSWLQQPQPSPMLLKNTQSTTSQELQEQEANLIQFASFLHSELPIRLAHRIEDLEHVPLMSQLPSVISVKETYLNSFRELISHKPIETIEDERAFAAQLERLYQNHSSVLINMARGAFELRQSMKDNGNYDNENDGADYVHDFSLMTDLHAFLDRFHASRIGIRILAGQYLALRNSAASNNNATGGSDQNYIGMVNVRTSPYEIVQQAIDDATFMCARRYGDAPEVIVRGRLDLDFPYIPTHLHYILLELLKNSMRATVDWNLHQNTAAFTFPPVSVIIADGKDNEDLTIKVSDEGGGIPRSHIQRIWSYLFTTADPAIQEASLFASEDHSIDSPLAGLGYGLPISRSYARYFGGDLSIMSMEGHGTDAFVHLRRLG